MRRAFGTADFVALCVGQFLAHQTALTFSVLIPILTTEWRLSASQAGFILGGFQFGTLVAYVIVGFLLDRVRSKPIMVWSAVLVGVGDLLFALGGGNFISGFMLRLVVGVLFGGLYLPALKHIAETISLERRGTATGLYIGMVVGAYAAPLFYVGLLAPRLGWRSTMAGVAALELLGALLMAWKVRDMPRPEGVISGILQYLSDVLRNPPARRVILAYTGHNWELFGMWGWLTPFMVASLVARGGSQSQALAWGGLLAAGAIGAGGGAGAVAGGRLSDRLGRARAASIMLTLSLACSLTFGWLFRAPLALLTGVAVIYGFASLADSPSYSARLMEVVPPRSLGGAFSLQMLTGWAATAVAPPLFGAVLDATASRASSPAQWGWAFTLLAVGPLVGIIALLPLREARRAVRPGAETPQISRARPNEIPWPSVYLWPSVCLRPWRCLMRGNRPVNLVREALGAGRFLTTVEFATPPASEPFEESIRPVLMLARETGRDPRIDALAITDRSRSDHDHDPITLGGRVAETSGKVPIVHWAGKDRGSGDLEADLRRAAALGLDTLLLVTGDKVRHPPRGRIVRYLDSVNALHLARRQHPAFLLAAAVSPFKYREEELMNQYLKAAKKLRAGADLLITQVGWDMTKLAEARRWFDAHGVDVPIVAEVLFLTPRRARHIRRIGLAGVIITDSLTAKLEEEARESDGGAAAAFRRLALQVVGARHLGYRGVQVSGLHVYEKVARLLEEVERLAAACPTRSSWQAAWSEVMTTADGRPVETGPADGFYLASSEPDSDFVSRGEGARASSAETSRFRVMQAIDRMLFREGSTGARLLGSLLRPIDAGTVAGRALRAVEGAIKGPLLGCQTCGFCRLPHTHFVCPETCPKGLANGPCGGTRDNQCEFGDRECIHNQIYRLAKQAGTLRDLEEVLIPPVPDAAWGTCSWVHHFRGGEPQAIRLRATPAEESEGASGKPEDHEG